MSLARFVTELFESGRVMVLTPQPIELEPEVDGLLLGAERIVGMNLAGTAPAFSLPAAKWAALLLYRACQFVVCRDVDSKVIEVALEEKCPEAHSPETDYSVDLLFRYLPDVFRMTRALASGDPLLQTLLKLAREWPLSSVGIPDVGPIEASSFIGHPTLRQLYADRIILRADTARLGDPIVDSALREALGAYPELCKPMADALDEMTNPNDEGTQ